MIHRIDDLMGGIKRDG
ncbi:hypothetical protein CGLO_16360 [Colletotrichum gloeosporioides Cg-14]|uniref:Uncharacterized protein n=1 Tax=Colletotrichum gloeosporioides (strain Cg-14) TaxID=1237896 RepID=T0JW97_COLGC|nr:hypothetical protein CGLO_16360 [Colletotrichum gloeosporioides Cg-14]